MFSGNQSRCVSCGGTGWGAAAEEVRWRLLDPMGTRVYGGVGVARRSGSGQSGLATAAVVCGDILFIRRDHVAAHLSDGISFIQGECGARIKKLIVKCCGASYRL